MATDLTKVQDHPTALLRKAAEESHYLKGTPVAQSAFKAAADTLKEHEKENGVTFAALDNEALARVAEAYETYRDDVEHPGVLASAIADLLGLDD